MLDFESSFKTKGTVRTHGFSGVTLTALSYVTLTLVTFDKSDLFTVSTKVPLLFNSYEYDETPLTLSKLLAKFKIVPFSVFGIPNVALLIDLPLPV